MTQKITFLVIIILLGVLFWFVFLKKPETIIVDNTNYSLIDKLQYEVVLLKSKATDLTIQQKEYEEIAASLNKYIATHKLDCPEIVEIQDKEITALRTGLEKCKEAKGIQVKTIKTLDSIVVINEVVLANISQTNEIAIKEAKLKGRREGAIGVGILAAAIAILLL